MPDILAPPRRHRIADVRAVLAAYRDLARKGTRVGHRSEAADAVRAGEARRIANHAVTFPGAPVPRELLSRYEIAESLVGVKLRLDIRRLARSLDERTPRR